MTVNPPEIKDLKVKRFTTYRRLWLDTCLQQYSSEMRGLVVDIGGKRENKRGSFAPPEKMATAWWYINLDLTTNPNIFADVGKLPIQSESVDVALCTEVLEHLADPIACVNEVYRILKRGGVAFFSAPFMYPIHADPYDFQRYTVDGLQKLLSVFRSTEYTSMGGYLGTLGMLMEIGLPGISGQQVTHKLFRRSLGWLASYLYKTDIKITDTQPQAWRKFSTGYFVRVLK